MIERKEYLNQIISWKDKQIIKVISGVRRCGKSTLFSLYIRYLKSVGVDDDQIIFLNLEDLTHSDLLDYQNLYSYVTERLCKDRMTYIFLDEVQNCTEFERAVDSLFIQPNTDVYITGSNAFLLSGELATLLSGRYVEISMLPLGFTEYLSSSAAAGLSRTEAFQNYLHFGSFPYMALFKPDENIISSYLEGVFNTILIKDVAVRENISDVSLLESIVKTIASSVGSSVSVKRIADTIRSSGRGVSFNTVEHYLRSLTDSYIFYRCDRYDIKGRQHLKTLSKYYIVDSGLRNFLTAGSSADTGHLIENTVYLELLRRGYHVSTGKFGENEVDFVTSAHNEITYYQVCASLIDPSTLKRELAPLQKIADHHPKILLSLDDIGAGSNYDGIRQYNLIDWLLNVKS